MSHQEPQLETASQSIRHVAKALIDDAIAQLQDASVTTSKQVHEVRKCCKKLRALLRLVRPCFKDHYHTENIWFRDLARRLSGARDTEILFATLRSLSHRYRGQLQEDAFASFSHTLVQRQVNASEVTELLTETGKRLHEARQRTQTWTLSADGFEAVAGGLEGIYRRARQAMNEAASNRTTESFHDWRKQVKYHLHHLQFLDEVWDIDLKGRIHQAKKLADLLGEEHDFAVLDDARAAWAERSEADSETDSASELLRALVAIQRERLTKQMPPLGQDLFAVKPKEFLKRVGEAWSG